MEQGIVRQAGWKSELIIGSICRPQGNGASAVQLLIETIAESSDRMREKHAGGEGVGEAQESETRASAGDVEAESTEGDDLRQRDRMVRKLRLRVP